MDSLMRAVVGCCQVSEGRVHSLSITPAILPWATFGGRTTTSESGVTTTDGLLSCVKWKREEEGRRKEEGGGKGSEGITAPQRR